MVRFVLFLRNHSISCQSDPLHFNLDAGPLQFSCTKSFMFHMRWHVISSVIVCYDVMVCLFPLNVTYHQVLLFVSQIWYLIKFHHAQKYNTHMHCIYIYIYSQFQIIIIMILFTMMAATCAAAIYVLQFEIIVFIF